jgi:hypothetical protein
MRSVQFTYLTSSRKNYKVVDFGEINFSRHSGIVVPATAQRVLCGGNPLADLSMSCLAQRPWRFFLMARYSFAQNNP